MLIFSFFYSVSVSFILIIEGNQREVPIFQVELQTDKERIRVSLMLKLGLQNLGDLYMKTMKVGSIEKFKIFRSFLQSWKNFVEKYSQWSSLELSAEF